MAEQLDTASLQPDTSSVPRIRLSEIGYTGLNVLNGQILEESRRELQFPNSIDTYKKMALDTTLSSALSLYEMMISRVKWDVEPPEDATPQEKARAEYVESLMDDMEHSWWSFIREVTSMYTYGFCVNEKVFRRRYKANGSRFNDGLVGIKKLPIRSQDTISKWLFSDNGRELAGLEQDLTGVTDLYRYTKIADTVITIPRDKFLLFRANPRRESPEGNSPLKSCYMSWKWRVGMEEHEAVGVTREMRGVPIVYIPPRYMSSDASQEEKEIYEYWKNVVRNLHYNEQAGMVMPLQYDPEAKQPLFKFELMSIQGTKGYDVNAIINRYDNKMLMAFFSDLLKMGQEKVGSFSLAGAKTSMLAMAIEYRLSEITDVLNSDLIKQIYALNGWEDERLPKFVHEDLDEADLDEFSKAIQRIKAVGLISPTAGNVNTIAEKLGLPDRVEEDMDQDELNILLGKPTSRSGDGMEKGAGNGTSDTVSADDNSSSNLEN